MTGFGEQRLDRRLAVFATLGPADSERGQQDQIIFEALVERVERLIAEPQFAGLYLWVQSTS